MKKINFEEYKTNFEKCKQSLDNYVDKEALSTIEVADIWVDDPYNNLNFIFKHGLPDKSSVKNMVIKSFSDYNFSNLSLYEYDTVNLDKTKLYNNIAVIKNNKPIFFASHTNFFNGKQIIVEDIYTTYFEENGKIDNKIKVVYDERGESKTTIISLTSKPLKTGPEYFLKTYKFNEYDNNLLSVEFDDSIYKKDNIVVDNILNKIEEVSLNIKRSFDAIVENDQVKKYEIKRKIKK